MMPECLPLAHGCSGIDHSGTRPTLANQYKILATTSEDNAAAYARNAEILLRGHRGLYHYIFDGISAEVPESVTGEVHDILEMFFGVRSALDELPEGQAVELDTEKLSFKGFAAGREPHYGQSKSMVERLDLYRELKGSKFDSHSETDMIRYRRMVPVYKAALKTKGGITLEVLRALQDL